MTPGARVQAAIELLDDILAGRPAEQALTGWARRSRFAGSKDRAAIRDHVFQALRCRKSYAALGGAQTGRGIMIGALRASGQDLSSNFNGVGHAPAPLTEAEQVAGCPHDDALQEIDLPDWIIPHLSISLGGEVHFRKVADDLRHRAPVMLRVNTRKSSRSDAIDALRTDGITADPASISSTALVVTHGARAVARSEAYLTGLVEVQDGSSQAAMDLIHIPEGARVLDYCAGGGGKVLALAARADAKWFAHDALPQRLKDLPDRASRAGVDVQILSPEDLAAQRFDLVLCDVPCSGSGTWRRTPDAKWRFTTPDLEKLHETQNEILRNAHKLVNPGGSLVYATCSLLRSENEDRVSEFCSKTPGWEIQQQDRWPVHLEGDGFFCTHLKRIQ